MYKEPLAPGNYYHIYNRGINGENIFREERNYHFFLKKMAHYIVPVAEVYAYCLLPNHFHLLVRTREQTSARDQKSDFSKKSDFSRPDATEQFRRLFISYAKAINRTYTRTGSLFQHRFGRLRIDSDRYLRTLVRYIHQNPQRHGIIDDFRDWPHSSYQAIISRRPTRLARDSVLGWFDHLSAFVDAHTEPADDRVLRPVLREWR